MTSEDERRPQPADPDIAAPGGEIRDRWDVLTLPITLPEPQPVLARVRRLRQALIAGLWQESFLQEAFERIAQRSGVAEARARLIAELDGLAQTRGLPGRAALFVPDGGRKVGPVCAEVQRLWVTYSDDFARAYWRAISYDPDDPDDRGPLPIADREAMEARLQDPATLFDLADHVGLRLHLYALGRNHLREDLLTLFAAAQKSGITASPITIRYDVPVFYAPTSPIPPTRHVRDNLALDDREAVRAFLAGRAQARQEAQIDGLPVGPSTTGQRQTRMPKHEGAHLTTWVRWLLAHRLHGKSVRQIARDDAAADHRARGIAHEPNHRKVQHAINEVVAWLAPGEVMDLYRRERRQRRDPPRKRLAMRKNAATRKNRAASATTKATRKRTPRR